MRADSAKPLHEKAARAEAPWMPIDEFRLPRLAFVHVPKTAGTSLRAFLEIAYKETSFPGLTTLDYKCYSDESLAQYRLYCGHAYLRDIVRLPADTIRLTVFRDPVSRAISLYKYYKRIENDVDDKHVRDAIISAKTKGIMPFLYSNNPFLIEHLHAGQLRQFLDESVLHELGHSRWIPKDLEDRVWDNFIKNIGTFRYCFTNDYLQISALLMSRELGLDMQRSSVPRLNASDETEHVDDQEIMRAIWDISPLDYKAYAYARQREASFLNTRLDTLFSQE